VESRNCSLNLKDITDIFLGKRTDVFESVGASSANADCCFTLMSRNKAIDLEAQSAEDLNLWLFGLNSILTQVHLYHTHTVLTPHLHCPDTTLALS
jgi:hypothetical protein